MLRLIFFLSICTYVSSLSIGHNTGIMLQSQTILIESLGEAAEWRGNVLGYFDKTQESLNGRPVYKQKGGGQFLYHNEERGTWQVSDKLGKWSAFLKVTSEDATPISTGWEYWRSGKWRTDNTLTVTTRPADPSSFCTTIQVAATGPAASVRSEKMGQYYWEGEWLNGRKLFRGGRDGDQYLRVPTGQIAWSIDSSKDSKVAGISSGRGTTCPCQQEAGPSIREGMVGWKYAEDGEWYVDRRLEVTCRGYYEIKSSGGAAQHQPKRMGQYIFIGESISGFPVFEKDGQYLYVTPDEYWMVGSNMSSTAGGMYNVNRNPTPKLPPVTGWKYTNDGWHHDASLTVTFIPANLRLVGRSKPSEGNVFYKGKPVCDDTFSTESHGTKNGEVICRELGFYGFERFTRESHFGSVPKDFSMGELKCNGTESRLEDCPHTTNKNCGAQEGAGVVCIENLRLVGGSKPNMGNVFYKGKPVCDDGFDTKSFGTRWGEVVCRELGFAGLERFTLKSHFGSVPADFSMDEVKCNGTESRLEDCPHSTDEDCGGSEGAGVVCIENLRLVGGSKSSEGNIFYRGKPVCDDGFETDSFGTKTGEVICRELGFAGLERFTTLSHFGKVPEGLGMDDVKCNGTESHLEECPHTINEDCGAQGGAGVVCIGEDICQNGKGEDYSGSVNKTKSGFACEKWSSQSSEQYNSLGNHNYCKNPDGKPGVWCFSTNPDKNWEFCDVPVCDICQNGKGEDYTGSVSKTESGFACENWSIQKAEYNILGDHNYCRNTNANSRDHIWCFSTNPDKEWEFCDVPHCDLCQNGQGEDYSGSVSKTESGFACEKWSSESSAQYNILGNHNYCRNPDGGPGVWCFSTNPDKEWELCDVPVCKENLRLVGGSKPSEGNIFYKGKPVCDDTFTTDSHGTKNGEVICRELGFYGFERFTRESYFGSVPADFSMKEVKCNGTESRLEDCPHTTNENCGAQDGAGVVCIENLKLIGGSKPSFGNVFYKGNPVCDYWN